MKYKFLCIAAALTLLLSSLTACSTGLTGKTDDTSKAPSGASSAAGTSASSAAAEPDDDHETASAASASDMFTSRDKETTWDEAAAVRVALSDSGVAEAEGITVSGSTVTVTKAGTYVFTGTLSDGQILVDTDKNDKVQLVLAGVSVTSSSSAPLYIRSADKVFLTIADGTQNTLTAAGAFVAIDDNNVDGAVYSKEDLTINGGGSLTVVSSQGHGIVSKDSLVITGGTIDVTAAKHGLQGKDDIRISDGALTVTSGKDGLHAANDDDETLGFIYIEGGSVTVSAEDDGIHADNYLTVEGGNIAVLKSYEGLEAKKITIDGGNIDVTSSDDGVNAAGGASGQGFGFFGRGGMNGGSSDYVLSVNGGVLTVNAGGDGIDSNGVMYITGGEVYVSGPTNAGNGAIDYEMEGVITGGTLIAAGASGMAQNFGNASTQGTMLLSVSGNAGDKVTLADENGNVLASYTPQKAFQTLVISAPGVVSGGVYTVTVGSVSRTVTMNSTVYSEGGMGGMGGMGGPGGMGGQVPGGMGGQVPGGPGMR